MNINLFFKNNSFVLDLYSGIKYAYNNLGVETENIIFKSYDTKRDPDVVRDIINSGELGDSDLIIGPLYGKPIEIVKQFCLQNKILMINPLSSNSMIINDNNYSLLFQPSLETVASSAATGTGCGPNSINYVLGITKAYTTRVGEGPFPTELNNEIGELLGNRGKEFGTVTSRKRRCGWFDGVLVRQTVKISGIDAIALTKLDVLDELDEIKICVEYQLNGKKINYLPAASEDQFNIKPIYKTFPGWKSSTQGIRNIKDLPEKARNYIYALEDFIGAKVSSISTSPERDDTILIEDPFTS